MQERETAILNLAITSVLCLNLEHVTLLAGEEFGASPPDEVAAQAVRDCTELFNGLLTQHGGLTIEDDFVSKLVPAAWEQVMKQREQRLRVVRRQPFSPLSPD